MKQILRALAFVCVLTPALALAQVQNPGVQQSGAVTPGNLTIWGPGVGQVRDGGPPPTGGDIDAVAITSGNLTVTGSPCPSGSCAFTVDLPAVVTGAVVGSATVTPVLTFDNFGRVTNISSATIAPPFSAIAGSLACSQTPALTGDITTSAGSCATSIAAGVIVNADINAGAGIVLSKLAAIGANTVVGALTATTPSALAVPSCSGAASALTWTSGTGFGCNTIASGGTVTNIATAGLASGGPITTTGTITVTAANKTQQETGSSATVAVTPLQQQSHDSAAKAWVTFTGATPPVILASYNVTSVTRTSAGVFPITFTTAFASANYSCVSVAETTGAPLIAYGLSSAKSASSFTAAYATTAPVGTDPVTANIVCYGRQ